MTPWRRRGVRDIPPRILLALFTTAVVALVLGWRLVGDRIDSGSDGGEASAATTTASPASSTPITVVLQPGWLAKGSSRYSDNGSGGGDPLPIATVPVVPGVPGSPVSSVPPRVKVPKSATTTTLTPRQQPPVTPAPRPSRTDPPVVATNPPPTAPPPPPPTSTPTTSPPTTAAPTTVAPG